MPESQEHLTYRILDVLDRRCLNCPATLASDTGRAALGFTDCRFVFVPPTLLAPEGEAGCKKGPVGPTTVPTDNSRHIDVE